MLGLHLATALATGVATVIARPPVQHQATPAQLVWSDEFESLSPPDPGVWSHDLGAGGWGNQELQEYTGQPANVRVEEGLLVISVQEQELPDGKRAFTSGRIKTENKLTVLYGTIEARIQVPDLANGLWPAFWTLGNDIAEVGWPSCGELDILEMGTAAAIERGVVNQRVSSAAHWETADRHTFDTSFLDLPTDLSRSFHTFRMEWTPSRVSTAIDGQTIWTLDITPEACADCSELHRPHFLLLNLAVGGTFPGLPEASEVDAPLPARMLVDWVRIYDNGFTRLGGSSIQPDA